MSEKFFGERIPRVKVPRSRSKKMNTFEVDEPTSYFFGSLGQVWGRLTSSFGDS